MFGNEISKIDDNNFKIVSEDMKKSRWKNYDLVLFNEDLHIDTISIPTTKFNVIDKIIKNHVEYTFRDMRNICYSYNIVSRKKHNSVVQIFCINSIKTEIIKKLNSTSRVRGVYLIQMCYQKYFNRVIKKKDFIGIFQSDDQVYIQGKNKSDMVSACKVSASETCEDDLMEGFNYVISILKKYEADFNPTVCLCNFNNVKIIKLISQSYEVKDLGAVKEAAIIKRYIGIGV